MAETAPQAPADDAWWSRQAAALFVTLGSAPVGLAAAEAARRLAAIGPNAVAEPSHAGAARLLWRQVTSPLVIILLLASGLSLLLRDWVDAATIGAIVAGSALLGFSQELRASRAVAQLRQRLALTARVRRGGRVIVVPARELVPGDGRVLEARDFLVNQASLTGESLPVEKSAGVLPAAATLAERVNCVHLGSSVRSGQAVVSLLTELAVLLVLRTHAPAWRSRPGRWLAAATVAVAVLALALPYLAPVAGLLGFVPLPLLAALLGVVAAYVAATEAAKRWFWRSRRKGLRQ
jgi:magnesium-transporting ATPase (P-type)